jgi:hypothetical protein
MADEVHTIRFIRLVAPYLSGEVAGFEPALADRYVGLGYATYVDKFVPRVAPDVAAMDARRRAEELKHLLKIAEREAVAAAATAQRARKGSA